MGSSSGSPSSIVTTVCRQRMPLREWTDPPDPNAGKFVFQGDPGADTCLRAVFLNVSVSVSHCVPLCLILPHCAETPVLECCSST